MARKRRKHTPRKLVFCLPGRDYTDGFVNAWTRTFQFFYDKRDIIFTAMYSGSDIYAVRNRLLTAGFPGDKPQVWEDYKPCNGMDYDYLIWIDSDQVWRPEQVERLLSHDVDIVAAATPIDLHPVGSRVAAGYWGFDEEHALTYLDGKRFPQWKEDCRGAGKENLIHGELLKVDFSGFAMLVVKRGVFESIGYPWFQHLVIDWYKERGFRVECSEDTGWCYRVGQAGFDVHVDPTVIIGHQKRVLLWGEPKGLSDGRT